MLTKPQTVRVATASDRLTLAEEYANQVEWRAAADKLTFIVCQPMEARAGGSEDAVAGVDDAPGRMVGDINFFLYPWEDEEEEEQRGKKGEDRLVYGEVDVMIAKGEHRGLGLGRAAVTALLHFVLQRHRSAILAEAAAAAGTRPAQLRRLVVKIQATNAASIGLFTGLGFRQRGGVNYFGEVEMVQDLVDGDEVPPEGYVERTYVR